MGEYISREVVLKAFKLTAKNPNKEYQRGMQDTIDCLVPEVIADIPAADVQPVNQWISVDDRLPNIDKRVLVYIPRPDNHYNIEIAYISEGNDNYPYWVLRDKSQFYSTRFHYISYWMPLPEPPQD